MAAPALKNLREMGGGGGGFDVFFNLKVYSTNFMPFFFDNLCRLLGQEFLMFADSPPPP